MKARPRRDLQPVTGCLVREPSPRARNQLQALLMRYAGIEQEVARELAGAEWHVALANVAYCDDYPTDGLPCTLGEYKAALQELIAALAAGVASDKLCGLLNQHGCGQEDLLALAGGKLAQPVVPAQLTPAARTALLRVSRAKLAVATAQPRQQGARQVLARLLWQNWPAGIVKTTYVYLGGRDPEAARFSAYMVTLAWLIDRFGHGAEQLDDQRVLKALVDSQGHIRSYVRAGKPPSHRVRT